ncbi:HAD-superfamily hydrolase, subfamily IIB [Austwickia chelonae]|uniref:Putative hydrolase n=1 Tax=Austwickia chelonae NBRC 105200 TaxID=1184607 RepID=K6UN35_9MICO|nr:Cof-type HAD-IIB family hydrolase [Austwickia chelonae]GAB78651.1 putative hydrolase [Austwickia chelonae NBRC 105200]SEW34394.1 HAD-superfamily hydrolase, subfamily IIB [Austwickia chelonae]
MKIDRMTTAGPGRLPFPERLPTSEGRHLVAIDLDGTTLHHDGSLSQDVIDAVAEAQEAGHDIVVATGRSLIATVPVATALGLVDNYLVCSNGAVTAALDADEPGGARLLDVRTFDPGPALSVLRDAWPDAQMAVEEVGRGFKVSGDFEGTDDLEGRIRVVDWAELVSTPTTRVTFRSATGTSEDFLELVERIGLHGVNYAVGFTAWLDIAPEGVSKASGLERIARELGSDPMRTVAVGDQRNDLEMLQWAACGVAMGNAPPEVQAVADLVTAHVDEDGLAVVLRALPPGQVEERCA